ncbi:MAG: nitrate reductase subunit beta [Acidobacteriota bacterium]
MNIQLHRAAVWFLDRCNGCGSCIAACKTVWNREPGSEAMEWLRVESGNVSGRGTAPTSRNTGAWVLESGELRLKSFRRTSLLTRLFHHPDRQTFEETGEPWTWDPNAALEAPLGPQPVQVEIRSAITGSSLSLQAEPVPTASPEADSTSLVELEEPGAADFSFFLPVFCAQCLNPSCVAACPSDALVKREADGVVEVEEGACRGWGSCVPACPYGMVQTNWRDGRARKCHFCLPAGEDRVPLCADSCPTQALVVGWVLYDRDAVAAAAAAPSDKLVEAQRNLLLDPRDAEVMRLARRSGIPDAGLEAARNSPVYDLFVRWRLALPLRPDWRTVPMSFYVPPLPPATRAAGLSPEDGGSTLDRVVDRFAALFTAGARHYARETLVRLEALRARRDQRSGADRPSNGRVAQLLSQAALSPAEADEILAGLAALFAAAPANGLQFGKAGAPRHPDSCAGGVSPQDPAADETEEAGDA